MRIGGLFCNEMRLRGTQRSRLTTGSRPYRVASAVAPGVRKAKAPFLCWDAFWRSRDDRRTRPPHAAARSAGELLTERGIVGDNAPYRARHFIAVDLRHVDVE
jgi:hypothetical protein